MDRNFKVLKGEKKNKNKNINVEFSSQWLYLSKEGGKKKDILR